LPRIHFTLRQLQVFEAVARHLSFTRAAEELHLTQPAVSMQVKQLESQVGVPLVEHSGKRIRITEAGREVERCARDVAGRLERASDRLVVLRGGRGGHLRVGVASTVNYFAPRLIAAFCAEHQGVRVTLDVTNRERLLRILVERQVDVALMGQPPEGVPLAAEPFMDNPLVLIGPLGHRLAGARAVALARLAGEPFIVREPGSGTRRAFERFCAEHGIEPPTGPEMSSNEAIKQSVEAGLGLAVVSAHTIELELAAGRLAVLDVEHFPIVRQWYVAHRRGRTLPPVAERFARFVVERAGELAAGS